MLEEYILEVCLVLIITRRYCQKYSGQMNLSPTSVEPL